MTSSQQRQVFAHYFTWFARRAVSGAWEHWNWEGPGPSHDPDRLIDGREDVAAVDLPLIGAYDSSLPAVQAYHLDLAAAAGIDAFCVDWYGAPAVGAPPGGARNRRVHDNFASMLQAAGSHRVKLCICYEEKILFEHADDAARLAAGRAHAQHIARRFFPAPGYWRVAGRPVLVIWGNNRLPVRLWQTILQAIEPHRPWILYSFHEHDPGYVNFCHGFYPWVEIGDLAFQRAGLEAYHATLERYRREAGVSVAGGVWPGFNDTGVWGWGGGPRVIADPHDRLYDLTWEIVLRHMPDWVSIATWNDWNEGSNIEPGLRHGTKYLRKTATYIEQFKGSRTHLEIESLLERYRHLLRDPDLTR